MTAEAHLQYRPEIDGLRAIAILLVVFYHADLFVTGGYIGVDVFFVLSGFLITSLIRKDLERGRFTFRHFWERRARRIAPALIAVSIATLIAGYFSLLPAGLKALGAAATAQSLFSANIHYWRSTGYFGAAAEEMPLLHTWSLAVEEQFYIFIPVAMWALYRLRRVTTRDRTFAFFTVTAVLSFGASLYCIGRWPTTTFFLLPTRAWELLLGAIVPLLPLRSAATPKVFRELLSLLGLGLIVVPAFTYTKQTLFPGITAVPPCLGTAFVVWSNERDTDGVMPTRVAGALANRAMVAVGLISYSLYLWHWPFLAFGRYLQPVPFAKDHNVAALALATACSLLSYKLVETPFRTRRLGKSPVAISAYAVGGLAVVALVGVLFYVGNGLPARVPAQATAYASAAKSPTLNLELTAKDIAQKHLLSIGDESAAKPSVLVWGDSHAMSVVPAVDDFLRERKLSGRVATHSSTAPVLDWFKRNTKTGLNASAPPFCNAVLEYVRAEAIPTVILAAYWTSYTGDPAIESSVTFSQAFTKTIETLAAMGTQIYVLLDVPLQALDVPAALGNAVRFQSDLTPFLAKPSAESERDGFSPPVLTAVNNLGTKLIDPKPRFLDASGTFYRVELNGTALYRDKQHLTPTGARLMILPLLRQAIAL